MKTITLLLLTVLLLQASKTNSQITLDHIVTPIYGIGSDFYTVQISPTETKYVFCDTTTNTFSLYNMDFTPFLTNVAVPEPFTYCKPLYITRSLFDCDTSNIEYAYGSTTESTKTFYIMRTDGTELFRLDSANYAYASGGNIFGMADIIKPIINTSNGAKLFLQRPNNDIYIYSLCDTLISDVFDFTAKNQSFVKIFPNPTSNTLTFEIDPPDNINEYELIILDNNAKEINREKVNFNDRAHIIDVSNFSSGNYFYSLRSKNKTYQSGKFIIAK